MTQSTALIQLQTALATILDTVAGITVHDTYPEDADTVYPIVVFGPGASDDDSSVGAASGDRTSNVSTSFSLYTDSRSRLDALTLGNTIEAALDTTLTLTVGTAVDKPHISPVTVSIDPGTGFWQVNFEVTQIIDNL
jgi:hypothetical protein